VDELPKHLANKGESYFLVLNKETFLSMTTAVVQAHLRTRHIVISDANIPALTFDRQGFRELDSLYTVVDIEGD
jgi:hypothetical protein